MHCFSGSLLVVLNNYYEFFALQYVVVKNPVCMQSVLKRGSKNIQSLVMLERKREKSQ